MTQPSIASEFPLSPMQQGMLFNHLREPHEGTDIEQVVVHLPEAVDAARLEAAWRDLTRRHEVLRTRFRWDGDGAPRQQILTEAAPPFTVEDARPLAPAGQEAALRAFLAEDRRRGFALDQAPLFRLTLFQWEPESWSLVWTFHHALLDGRCYPVLLREVFAVPAAPAGPAAAPGYAALLQRRAALDEQLAPAAETFWKDLLAGFDTPVPLVIGRLTPEGAARERHGERGLSLDAGLTARLHRLAGTRELTMNAVLMGAWAILLHRCSGLEDILFGATRACRKAPGADAGDSPGLFINTVPVRVAVREDDTWLSLCGRLRRQWLDMRPFERTPLARLKPLTAVPPALPLFETLVVFEKYRLETALRSLGGPWAARRVELHEQTNFPVTLAAYDGDELSLKIEFDRRLLADDAIDRLLGHLRNLLEGMANDPRAAVRDLHLLRPAERAAAIAACSPRAALPSGGPVPGDGNATLHRLFEIQAARRPEAIALTCGAESLTYARLNAQANRLARALVRRGVRPDTLIGLCMERSAELIVALLAILKAGGAYLPIDLAYPAGRLAFLLDDAQAPLLLTQRRLAGSLPATAAEILCIEDLLAGPAAAADETNLLKQPGAPEEPAADHLAYCIYTSGTTGQPKGSLLTHRNAVRLFAATDSLYRFGAQDVWTLFHSCAFDFSVWEIWGALLYGGRLVVVPFLVSRSPEAFRALLAREQVTVLNQTPSAFRQLLQADETADPRDLALRYVIFGGEALEMQSLAPWFARHGDRRPLLVNMYGITETTVHVTWRVLSRDDLQAGSLIGVPLADLQVYILDPRGEPVPPGVPGEMYVGGAGLARGYLRRPELTGERFVPDHLTGRPAARLYRTGDLARFLPGGEIEYLGRIDQQVKIRGFRIEPGEIESVLCRHPAVREAVVLACADEAGGKRLVAWVVPASPAPARNALREHLQATLPDYMVPAAFVLLDRITLTTNGKVDRAALPAPEVRRPELEARYVAPRTPAEVTLAAIWSKVLRAGEVGVHDNFFELGGDSILSIQILSLARRAGLPLTPALLFAHPTIAALAAAAGAAPDTPAAAPAPPGGEMPPTPIAHWFFEQNLASPDHYNQACLVEIREPLGRRLLEQALGCVAARHEALRLRCVRQGDAWRLLTAPAGETVPLTAVRLAGLGPDAQCRLDGEAGAAQASLSLAHGPVWRAVFFETDPGLPDRLLLVVHHLAIDGVSWRPLLEDLETACRQLRAGEPVRLPPPTASLGHWAARLAALGAGGALRGELPWWQNVTAPWHTAGLAALLPDPGDPSNTEAAAVSHRSSLTAAETEALLRQVPAVYHTQVNDVLLTALARAWSLWSGGSALYTDLEGHGREDLFPDLDLSRTVGWFTALFPVRLELPGGTAAWSPGAALQSVKEQLRRIPRRGVGYGILRYLGGETSLGAHPAPRMVFNYLGQFDQMLAGSALFRLARATTGPWHAPAQRRRHTLELNCLVAEGRLECCWTGPASASLDALRDGFLQALRELLAHCLQPGAGGRTPSDFPLARLDQAALDRLVGARRDIEDVLPLSPIQTLFLSAAPAAGAGTRENAAFDQWHGTLQGELDVAALQSAWRATLRRHAILRTTIHAAGSDPVQLVHRDPAPLWTLEDWRATPPALHAARWSDFLRRDRARPLPLTEAPVLRFALVRLGERTSKFLWSVPALLLDGWSWPVVFRDVGQFYEALTGGAAPPAEPVRPYRDYLEWLGRQSGAAAQHFWTGALAGFTHPTPLAGEAQAGEQSPEPPTERYARQVVPLPEAATDALQALARSLRITPAAIVQAAWALLLARHTGHTDVVFGAAFSGRPADLPGVESIAGPFVNNLPVRVTVDPASAAGDFLRQVHARLAGLSAFQCTPLVDIRRCSEVPWRHRLFDSLVVVQNYLVDPAARRLGSGIAIADFHGPLHTNYPVLLLAEPGAAWQLTVLYDRQAVAAAAAERWVREVAALLTALPGAPGRPVGELACLLSPRPPAPPPSARSGETPGARRPDAAPPRTEMERRIADIWAGLFGLETIGVEENFFDLGAHSLLLVQAHGQLREALQTDLPIVALFEYPTVRSLAGHLAGQAAGEPAAAGAARQQWLDRAQRQKQAVARLRARRNT